jgi:addiction module HigA family antidote
MKGRSLSRSSTITKGRAVRIRTHPGEVLREEYLKPLGLSARALAEAIGVPANRLTEIVRERRSVTADTAIRLGRYFDTDALFWINLQVAHDLSKAEAGTDYSIVPTRAA